MRMTEQLRKRVRKRGWDVVCVPRRPDVPEYSYTVGLAARGLREFVVFGFSPGLARPVLDDLAQRARDGERFPTGVALEDVLPGMPAVLVDVPDIEAQHYLSLAREFSPKSVSAFQIAWPDGQDLFPWQQGYDETFRARQVLLNPFVKFARRQQP